MNQITPPDVNASPWMFNLINVAMIKKQTKNMYFYTEFKPAAMNTL